jgi:uncharacterized membrane-anchored protein YjiN (DUF445 family)
MLLAVNLFLFLGRATVVIPRNKKRLTTGNIKQDRQGSGTTVIIPRNKKRLTISNIKQNMQGSGATVVIPRNKKRLTLVLAMI